MSTPQRFSSASHQAMKRAHGLAVASRCGFVETAHLFLGILESESDEPGHFTTLLQLNGVGVEEARLYALSAIQSEGMDGGKDPPLSTGARKTLQLAMEEARRMAMLQAGNEHLLLACVRHRKGQPLGDLLRSLGLDAGVVRLQARQLNAHPNFSAGPLHLLSADTERCLEAAQAAMRASYCGQISTAHLLLGILANRQNVAVETLRAAGVEVDALERQARAVITSDGQVATPQRKFSSAAKRALERAKQEALRNDRSHIGPQHLLFGLLPRRTSFKERLAFGHFVPDPLSSVWAGYPTSEIEMHYQTVWQNSTHFSTSKTRPVSWISFNWRWWMAGIASWLLLPLGRLIKFPSGEMLSAAFCGAVLVAIGAELLKEFGIRDRASSYICGVLTGLVLPIFGSR